LLLAAVQISGLEVAGDSDSGADGAAAKRAVRQVRLRFAGDAGEMPGVRDSGDANLIH